MNAAGKRPLLKRFCRTFVAIDGLIVGRADYTKVH